MKRVRTQAGMTAIGWLLVILLVISAALFLMKLVPIYIEGFNVGSVVSNVASDPQMRGAPPGKIVKTVLKRLDINMAMSVTRDDVYVTREKDYILIEIDYEVRKPVIGNLDIVVSFNKQGRIPVR